MDASRVEEMYAEGQDFEGGREGRRKERLRVAKEYEMCLNDSES